MNSIKLFIGKIVCFFEKHDFSEIYILNFKTHITSKGFRCKRCKKIYE